MKNWPHWIVLVGLLAAIGAAVERARACPFCSAVSLTFTEEIQNSDAAVLARIIEVPPRVESVEGGFLDITDPKAMARFEIRDVLKGKAFLSPGQIFSTLYIGEAKPGQTFLITGAEPPNVTWATPIRLTERAADYLRRLPDLAEMEEIERLRFFLNYLEDEDEILARDSYDEFAKAPFHSVAALKGEMNHDRLLGWIQDPKIPASRRRLYLTMLGLSGSPADLPMLESFIRSADQQALDATINAYLMLKGPDGLELIEELFLKNKDAEYTRTYSAIVALRVHGQEVKTIPQERLVQALRHMLDRPELADLVIPDLARWEDWGSTDKLVQLFKEADESSSWVRTPVINFLRASPEPRAKELLKELEVIDPKAVERANAFALPVAAAPLPADVGTSQAPMGGGPSTASPAETRDAVPPGTEESHVAIKESVPRGTEGAAVIGAPPGNGVDVGQPGPNGPQGEAVRSGEQSVAAAGTAPASAGSNTVVASSPASRGATSTISSTVWMIVVPVVAVAALVGITWTILRGTRSRSSA